MRRCPQPTGPTTRIPTLLGNDGTGPENYLNDHPVGLNAVDDAAAALPNDWDCTISTSSTTRRRSP